MKLSRKAAIELSISFLVTIIIVIVIFGLSIVFLRNLFSSAGELSSELDLRTQQQIESLLTQGHKVAVPFHTARIRNGESGMYGIGIYNIAQTRGKFIINISEGKHLVSGDILPKENILYVNEMFIENNERDATGIRIIVPEGTKPGKYVFDVIVTCKKADQQGVDCISGEPVYGFTKIYAEVT